MSEKAAFLQKGLSEFDAFLQADYGEPLSVWAAKTDWSDLDSLQISRALAMILKEPVSDYIDETDAVETHAKRRWALNDAKITEPAFEQSWQYFCLAEIENAQEKEPGQMAVPADPRRFMLRIRYERGTFSVLADHLFRLLCDRVKLPAFKPDPQMSADQEPGEEAQLAADLLRQVPGLERAEPRFIAGLVFLMSKAGGRGFADWCDDRSSAASDERL